MIARGEVALVMATLGLNNGLLNETTFTVVVLMTVVTTLLTPLLLKLAEPKVPAQPFVGDTLAPALVPTALEVERA
jgi:Kef-type K+ transport system membrane component KefB